jgi:hypothetical protein
MGPGVSLSSTGGVTAEHVTGAPRRVKDLRGQVEKEPE